MTTSVVAPYMSGCADVFAKSESDRAPFRPPIKLRHASSSHLPSRSSKKNGSESRKMRTFLKYKYYSLNFKEGQSLDPKNIPNCYLHIKYFIFFITLHTAIYVIDYHKYTILITPLLTSPSEFIWQVPHRCHPPPPKKKSR